MNVIGIICEYNPFHNGHIYHLKKVKELFPDSLIILVMSGNFTQRGIPSIMDKWDKTEIALEYGIDLVIELPFVFATQSADIFAHGAISILKEMKAEYLIFGSESNNIEKLTKLAKISLEETNYQEQIRYYLQEGNNYPTALNKALQNLKGEEICTPNDLLGLSYIKEILKQNASITPISIQRTNDYHSINLDSIASATSIRNAILQNKNIRDYVPMEVIKKLAQNRYFQNDYFPFLKYKIITTEDLSIFQTVDEGIERRIKKCILKADSWEQLVQLIKTKRYTYNKINRMLIHILCGFTKEQAKRWQEIEYIRVLGFSQCGQVYLNQIKKVIELPIITTFSKGRSKMLIYEQTITNVYATILPEYQKKYLMESEYKNKPKMRE